MGLIGTFFTSTVIIDTPSFSEAVGAIYTVAQPLFSSLWGIVLMIIGIGFVFGLVRLIMGKFNF